MKIVGIIPARYKSTRFEGKPLADICGKPMIWWVYQQVKKVKKFDDVFVATDSDIIMKACNELDMKCIMTNEDNKTPTDRIYEVSEKVESDYYISVNGDEPLISPTVIEKVIPSEVHNELYIANLMTTVKDPVEAIDPTNLKIVTNDKNEGIYISRNPVPFPKGTMEYVYKKHVGVYAFNKKALDFYHNTKRGKLESIEDIDLLRYIENRKAINFIDVECDTLSVDTYKDLERVRSVMKDS